MSLVAVFILGDDIYTHQLLTQEAQKQHDIEINFDATYKKFIACQNDPSNIKCSGLSLQMQAVVYNPKQCIIPLDSKSSAAQIVWHYRHCPTPTPTVQYITKYVNQPQQNLQKIDNFGSGVDSSGYQQALFDKATQIVNSINP